MGIITLITFREFWREYPRKVGKLHAQWLWDRMAENERGLAMRGLRLWKQADQWHRDGMRYIPYASTFLQQKRYLDEPWIGAFEDGE